LSPCTVHTWSSSQSRATFPLKGLSHHLELAKSVVPVDRAW
jgi:hypothetical protein